MPTVTVDIQGVSRDAKFVWDEQPVPLMQVSPGRWQRQFLTDTGIHMYELVVFGDPSDPWQAAIVAGAAPRNHTGHMSPTGIDGTGITLIGAQ